jgi:2-methylcitrate dehydratase
LDGTLSTLLDFTEGFALADVSAGAVQSGVQHIVDAIACALAGYRTEAAQAAVTAARSMSADNGATLIGASARVAAPYAAMANAVMVRTLDWNDGMLAQGGGHPSDMIPAILGTAEIEGASGVDVIEHVLLAYELLGGIGKVAPANQRGWDQGLFMAPAVALAVGRLRGLTRSQLANAASICLVSAVPLLVTRRGALSMWKGAATSVAVKHALDAVGLAAAGMTGPDQPFEGVMGVFDQLTGPFAVRLPADPRGRWVVELSHMKKFPAESHSQSLLALVPQIREFASEAEIDSITVESYFVMWNAIGRDESIYDPRNRETADHSLPYLLAAALVDGEIGLGSFTAERISDPALRPIMRKITVTENPAFTDEYRRSRSTSDVHEGGLLARPRTKITVTRRDGAQLIEELTYPKGHAENPMTTADIDEKFRSICAAVLPDTDADSLVGAWWAIGKQPDIRRLMATVARIPEPSA